MNRHGGSIRSAIRPLLHSSILFRPHQQPRVARLMVEAPGYCPPGPKCLFHPTVYRHSRLPGTPEIGILRVKLKPTADMAGCAQGFGGGDKTKKRNGFLMS